MAIAIDDEVSVAVNVSTSDFEDLTTYERYLGSYLTIPTHHRVKFNQLINNISPPVYLRKPATLSDFELLFHLRIDELQDDPQGGQGDAHKLGGSVYHMFTRKSEDITFQNSKCSNGNNVVGDGFGFGVRSFWNKDDLYPVHIFGFYNHDTIICPGTGVDSYEFLYWRGLPNTAPPRDIYVRTLRVGTAMTIWLYSDASFTQLLLNYKGVPFPSAGVTIQNINISPYSYFYPCAMRGAYATNPYTITGYVENILIY